MMKPDYCLTHPPYNIPLQSGLLTKDETCTYWVDRDELRGMPVIQVIAINIKAGRAWSNCQMRNHDSAANQATSLLPKLLEELRAENLERRRDCTASHEGLGAAAESPDPDYPCQDPKCRKQE